MRKLSIIALCLLSVVFIQCHPGRTETTYASDGKTTIKTTETKTMYTLEASFDEEKGTEIFERINAAIAPNAQFAFEEGDLDTNTSLDDGTTFHIEADDDELKLIFDKEKNSYQSYERVKELCEGSAEDW